MTSPAAFEPGTTFKTTLTITPDDMHAFAALSGDRNPLHTDDAFARSRGFEGPVVYGALILARLSEVIGMHLPGRDTIWTGVKADFRKPLYIGQEAQLRVEIAGYFEATGTIELTFTLSSRGQTLAKGTAETLVRGDG